MRFLYSSSSCSKRSAAVILLAAALLTFTLPARASAVQEMSLCVGKCGGIQGSAFFSGWTVEEVQAYMEFVHLLIVDMLATDAGVLRYGIERERNPLPRLVLYTGGMPLLWVAAAAYIVYVRTEAGTYDPPLRLLYLRRIAFDHALGSTLWIGNVGMRRDLSFRFTVFSIRW